MRYRKSVKRLPDGKAMLNVGCGIRMHPGWNNLDFSWYARLRRRERLSRLLHFLGVLSAERYQRLMVVDPDIIFWNLQKGIPFADSTFDVVYHSHVLEHIDRQFVLEFLRECFRVLRPDGIIRIVVPDLETTVNRYSDCIRTLNTKNTNDNHQFAVYDRVVNELFDQMVRTEAYGTSQQKKLVRFIERHIRGDADDIGERHKWMYDQYSLKRLLVLSGFADMQKVDPTTSSIPGWKSFYLDVNPDGSVYKPGSLYMEATKPHGLFEENERQVVSLTLYE